MVSVGLEPTTPALSAQCSDQLSYETIYKSYPTFAIGQMSDMEYFVSTLRNKATNQRPTFIAAYTRYRILYLSFFRRDTSTLTTISRGVCHHIYIGDFCFRKVYQPKLIANLNYVHQSSSDLLLALGGPGWCRSNYVRRRELYRLLRLPIRY